VTQPGRPIVLPSRIHPATVPASDGRRLVAVHGFTQTARSWDPLLPALRRHGTVVTVDAPGHGDAAGLDLDHRAAADALAATGGRAIYLGYSMGGRLCLRLAVDHADVLDGLVLISTTAGIDDEAARAERRDDDDRLAARIEAIGVDAFLDEWLAKPLFARLPRELAGTDDRRRNTAAGLASSLRQCGTGAQEPLWDRLAVLRERALPVLVVTGSADGRFVEIGDRLVDAIGPSARHVTVANAGHVVHLPRPDVWSEVVGSWLEGLDPQPPSAAISAAE